MKVLHICNQFWPSTGGIEKFTLDLCRESKKVGIETAVLCLNRGYQSETILPAQAEIEGIPIRRIPFVDLHYYKPLRIPLEELKNTDIIHLHGLSALSDFAVLAKPFHHTPIVANTHGGIFHTKNFSLVKKLYFFGFQRLMCKGIDQLVADSPNDFELFQKIAPPHLTLIENGVDLERFRACGSQKKGKNVFLFVGRISKNKRVDLLLHAFGILHQKGIDFELRLVGPDWGNLKTELQRLAEGIGIGKKTVFVGEVSEQRLVQEYCNARFFVSASRYEAFGISAIEAMAAGCIPILNRIASFKHFVEENRTGFLTDFEDSTGTAEKILEIMKKPLEGMPSKSKKAAKRFSWHSRIREWKSLYETVLQRAKKK